MRLNDEKRQALKVGDMLEFENRADGSRIMTEITSLDHFKSFNELYAHFDKKDLGYADNEKANPEDMSIYYSTEDIQKYGTLAIGVKKI